MLTKRQLRIEQNLKDAESQLIEGKLRTAIATLQKIQKIGRPSREQITKLAELLRRCGSNSSALKVLNKVVRPRNRGLVKPTEPEKILYASVLINLGAIDEGETFLQGLNESLYPKVLLYRAYAHIHRWDYKAAEEVLNVYLQQPGLSAYEWMHGHVNLLACYVHEQKHEAADALIEELLAIPDGDLIKRMRANIFRLKAMKEFGTGNFEEALTTLQTGRSELSQIAGLEELWFEKWENLALAYASQDRERQNRCFDVIRLIATRERAWEVLRDCDFHQGFLQKDFGLLRKAYFGTPFPAFRERILRDLNSEERALVQDTGYVLGDPIGIIYDTQTGVFERGDHPSLPIGSRFYRLLLAMSFDFYKPLSVLNLHHLVYPGEFFDAISSPAKVYQLLRDARKYFQEEELGIHIREERECYSLKLSGIAFKVPAAPSFMPEKSKVDREALAEAFGDESFSTEEAAKVLLLAPRSARRLLKEAFDDSKLEKIGAGRNTRYRIAS